MSFAIPDLLKTILEDNCKVTMESLDDKVSSHLITHIFVVDANIDIDVLLLEGGNLLVDIWDVDKTITHIGTGNPYAYASPIVNKMFNLNDRGFVKELSIFLHHHVKDSEIKIRYKKRK